MGYILGCVERNYIKEKIVFYNSKLLMFDFNFPRKRPCQATIIRNDTSKFCLQLFKYNYKPLAANIYKPNCKVYQDDNEHRAKHVGLIGIKQRETKVYC